MPRDLVVDKPGPGWHPESVAALAELLEELRQLAPEARFEPSGATFPAAVDEYLRAKGSQARQPLAR